MRSIEATGVSPESRGYKENGPLLFEAGLKK